MKKIKGKVEKKYKYIKFLGIKKKYIIAYYFIIILWGNIFYVFFKDLIYKPHYNKGLIYFCMGKI